MGGEFVLISAKSGKTRCGCRFGAGSQSGQTVQSCLPLKSRLDSSLDKPPLQGGASPDTTVRFRDPASTPDIRGRSSVMSSRCPALYVLECTMLFQHASFEAASVA